ncbi:MAG: alpha/beta fold hydrolase [Anaerolineales bacterium]|nr:alpha/beta fold hydrolase [Anaerolineales bacterium]
MNLEHLTRAPKNRTHQTPILLQHGAWHAAWCWEEWMEIFAEKGYEVHALSAPAHGGSDPVRGHINLHSLADYVRALETVVDRISPRPVVIGHSMGGAILQKYLENHTLPGAVLLASIPAQGILGFILRQTIRYPDLLISLLLANTYGYVKTPQRAKEQFLGPDSTVDADNFHRRLQRESFLVALQTTFPFANRTKILQGKTPILALAGEKDAIFTVDEEQKTAARYNVPLKIFPRQGHNLMVEPLAREVADFVDKWMTETLMLP